MSINERFGHLSHRQRREIYQAIDASEDEGQRAATVRRLSRRFGLRPQVIMAAAAYASDVAWKRYVRS